jgi:hypothetical protein
MFVVTLPNIESMARTVIVEARKCSVALVSLSNDENDLVAYELTNQKVNESNL